MSKLARFASSAAVLLALVVPASAAEQLVMNVDQTQILKTASKPGTIIIGSPGIVDASMQSGNIFLQGKGFGTTNIIILDRKGAEIGNYEVTVRVSGSNNLAMYKAGERYSYTCNPNCEASPMVGDNSNFMYSTMGAQGVRQEYLMRSTSTESQPTNGGTSGGGDSAPAAN